MKYRKFGNTDMLVSEIGFGAWAIGGNAVVGNTPIGWGHADDKESIAAINEAVEQGINFFDTADFYGLGHSETLIGDTVGKMKNILIATKAGHRNIDNVIQLDYTKAYLIAACEKSLKRLRRDTIDYYQLHSARLSNLQTVECTDAMQLLKQQGKIRYWGLSLNTFYPDAEAEYLIEKNLGDGFQLVLNIINQRATGTMQLAAANGYGVIARMALQFGLLTGKFTSVSTFQADDHRSFRFNEQILAESVAMLEDKIWPLCEAYNIGKTSLALSYVLSHPGVSTVIPGIRTANHVISNTQDIIQLQPADMDMIGKAYHDYFANIVALMEKQG